MCALLHINSFEFLLQLPKDGQPDAGLTKDYANSGLHRFKKPGSKNYQNIYPPSSTLHLSNIPSGVEEEDLRKAFQNINVTVQVSDLAPYHAAAAGTHQPVLQYVRAGWSCPAPCVLATIGC